MTFVASASRIVNAPREECFAKFLAYPSWAAWMPASFKPMRGPSADLRVGDRLLVSIRVGRKAAMPAALKVVRVRPGVEIAWRGGVPGVLAGEHCFLFHDEGTGHTRIRSEETWSGAVTRIGAVARTIRKQAEIIGAEQLDGFAGWLGGGGGAL